MMQNLLLTSLTPLKTKNEINCWENRPFATVWPENIQQNKKDVTRTIKKKKRSRTAFSTDQLRILEKTYSDHKYINSVERTEIAHRLKISDRCVKIWFQNRRMKEKKELSESSCDSSSELVSIESLSAHTPPPLLPTYNGGGVCTPPPLQVINEPTTEQISYYPDNTYQLPTYSNTNELQSTYEGMASSGSATYFYNEHTIYPTQYYPHDLGFSNGGHGHDQYTSEGNSCWTESQYPYDSTA